jgi:hypothetical protein
MPSKKTTSKPQKSGSIQRPRGEIGLGGVTYAVDRANEEGVLIIPLINAERSRALVRKIKPEQFRIDEHALIWSVYRKQLERDHLYDHAQALRVISSSPLGSDAKKVLNGLVTTAKNLSWEDARAEDRIRILAEDALRVQVLTGPAKQLIEGLVNPSVDITALRTAAKRADAFFHGTSSAVVPISRVHTDYIASIQARIDRRGQIYGVGDPGFDSSLGIGFAPGDTSVITGETGEGKSTVALNLARMLCKNGRNVAYCCWEEGADRALDKIISAEAGIPFTRIVRGSISQAEQARILEVMNRFSGGATPEGWGRIRFITNPFLEMWFNSKRDAAGRRIKIVQQDVLEVIRNIIADSGCDVIIYDMWDRSIQEPGLFPVEKSLEMTQQLHKDFAVHGILLAQTNIDKVRNQNAAKGSATIKGSKKKPEISDLVIVLDRPSIRGEVMPKDGKDPLFMKLEKQRVLPDGAHGIQTVEWVFDGRFQRISDPKPYIPRVAGSLDDGLQPLAPDGVPLNDDGSEVF